MSKLEALIQRLCPEGVEYKYLNDISIKISSGGTPKSGNSAYYNGTIPWLRTQEVDFNEISETEIKITDEGLKNSTAKWIPANCVIVAMYGATVGRVAINRIPLTTNQACCNIEVDPQCVKNRNVVKYGKREYMNHAPNDITKITEFNGVEYPPDKYFFCFENNRVVQRVNEHKWRYLCWPSTVGFWRCTCLWQAFASSAPVFSMKANTPWEQ